MNPKSIEKHITIVVEKKNSYLFNFHLPSLSKYCIYSIYSILYTVSNIHTNDIQTLVQSFNLNY